MTTYYRKHHIRMVRSGKHVRVVVVNGHWVTCWRRRFKPRHAPLRPDSLSV